MRENKQKITKLKKNCSLPKKKKQNVKPIEFNLLRSNSANTNSKKFIPSNIRKISMQDINIPNY